MVLSKLHRIQLCREVGSMGKGSDRSSSDCLQKLRNIFNYLLMKGGSLRVLNRLSLMWDGRTPRGSTVTIFYGKGVAEKNQKIKTGHSVRFQRQAAERFWPRFLWNSPHQGPRWRFSKILQRFITEASNSIGGCTASKKSSKGESGAYIWPQSSWFY